MTINDIINIVCEAQGITPEQALGNSQERPQCETRQLICYFAREYKLGSQTKIGKMIGKKHSTITYAIDTVNNMMGTDKVYALNIERIDKLIKVHIEKEELRLKADRFELDNPEVNAILMKIDDLNKSIAKFFDKTELCATQNTVN